MAKGIASDLTISFFSPEYRCASGDCGGVFALIHLYHYLVNISGVCYFQEGTLNTIHVQLVVGMDFVES
jgi:hypothetical protein